MMKGITLGLPKRDAVKMLVTRQHRHFPSGFKAEKLLELMIGVYCTITQRAELVAVNTKQVNIHA